jgi:hypothetical protein
MMSRRARPDCGEEATERFIAAQNPQEIQTAHAMPAEMGGPTSTVAVLGVGKRVCGESGRLPGRHESGQITWQEGPPHKTLESALRKRSDGHARPEMRGKAGSR